MLLSDMSLSSVLFLSCILVLRASAGVLFCLSRFLKKISSGLLTPFLPISFLCLFFLFLGGDLELGAGVLVLFFF